MSKEEILNEIKKISRLLLYVNSGIIKNELEKVANTDNRKMIWVLLDGRKMSKEIGSIIGISDRSVREFQTILETANLATNPWGKPATRIFDYIPPEWIELLPKDKINTIKEE